MMGVMIMIYEIIFFTAVYPDLPRSTQIYPDITQSKLQQFQLYTSLR